MKKLLLLSFFYLFLFSLSCTREVNVQLPGPVVEEGQISGRVILPQNTKADTAGLVVLSSVGSSIPVASKFALDTSGKVSTTVLNNSQGDVLLLGYNYPGQTDYSISSESTALALLMNTLTLRSLSLSGKLEMIEKIKADPAYKELVQQVTMGLQAGRAVTDTTNTEMIQAIATVFKSTTGLRTTATTGYKDPIKITTANTEVLLQNNQVAHTYVAGVYKDNKAVGPKYVIAGRTLFATSLSEAAAGVFGDGYGIPAPVQFTLSGNGEYTIKIRSGKPFAGDETLESRMARNENVHRFLLGILRDIFPIPLDCNEALVESVPATLTSIMAKREMALENANSAAVFAALTLEITGEALQSAEDLLEECGGDLDSFKFLKSVGKTFSLLGIATKFMTAANITAHTNDLFQAKASIDSCFQVVGLKLVKCGEQPVYRVDTVSGGNQKGEAGKAFPKPLVVKVRTEDGKPAIKATVNWVIKSGGGKVSATESETNYDGIAQISWTPGKGEQQLEAYANKAKGSTTALFKANGFDGNDRKVEIASGNSQQGQYGKELAKPLTIRVLNGEGKPEAGVEVTWKILAGGGDFGNLQRITNAEGLVSANWKLGPSGGQNVEVSVKKKDGTPAVGSPVVFTAGGGKEGSLGTLILGTWKWIKEYGKEDGQYYEETYDDAEDIDYLVFKENGALIDRTIHVHRNNELDESYGSYRVDENKRELYIHWDDDDEAYAGSIETLDESKMVLFSEFEDGYGYSEFERVAESGRISASKASSAKKTQVHRKPDSVRKGHSPIRVRDKY
ncbi:lipocalin family protein [Dyadobacter sp. CY323]|uniref:lipocalin family protein n=1 Tax=Dyadobacter sp. CY323 TaxID=2907302 RepID=UPI001F236C56|nr:lipocalin family protein [Dyadobacter sp. CY323]MCE6991462.1 lipocalin family protein [Dyadobacter sp. CY323]